MSGLRLKLLGKDVRRHRGALGIRDAASAVGVSAATMSRVENGIAPDLYTFAKLCRWLAADPKRYLGLSDREAATCGPVNEQAG